MYYIDFRTNVCKIFESCIALTDTIIPFFILYISVIPQSDTVSEDKRGVYKRTGPLSVMKY